MIFYCYLCIRNYVFVAMIRWLHISDLHLGSSDMSTDMLRDDLLKFLRRERLQCDYVFCTGDIRTAGSEDSAFTNEMAEYLRQLCKAVGVPIDRLFIVPGNHDVKRDIPERIETIHRMMFHRNGYYDPAKGIIAPNDMAVIMEGEKDFISFLATLYPADRVAMYGNPNIPHFNIETPDFNVLHVDSTISYTEDQEANDLIVGGHALLKVLQEIEKSKPTILLSHYPFTSLLQDEKKHLSIMLQKYGVQLWLAGHEHDHLAHPVYYLNSLQTGELRYEDKANASILIGEYNPITFRGNTKAYAWFPEGWAKYPYLDLDNKKQDRYDFRLTPIENCGASREQLAAREANSDFFSRLPQKVEHGLMPNIQYQDVTTTLEELLSDTWQSKNPHIIILADGGMGKTTMLLNYCKNTSSAVLYIPAEFLAASDITIETYCINTIYDGDKEQFYDSLRVRYAEPTLTLFIDGLNEVDAEAEKRFIKELQRFNILLKGICIVVTSRSNFTIRYSMPGYRSTVLCPLEDAQISAYFTIEEWSRVKGITSLHRLLRNPMMVTVYKEICSVLNEFKDIEFLDWILPVKNATDMFHDYYVAQLALMLKRGITDGRKLLLAAICIKEILPCIAYAYENSHRKSQSNNMFRDLLHDVLRDISVNEKELMAIQEHYMETTLPELNDIAITNMLTSELRLLYRDKSTTAFPHQIYRDYLSAQWIIRQSQDHNKILNLWNSRKISYPVMTHIRHGSGTYWKDGLANRVHNVGANYKGDNAGILVDNLLACFPGTPESGVPDYSGLWLCGHQLPDPHIDLGKINLSGSEIDETTIGLSSGDLSLYTNLCLSKDKKYLASVVIKDIGKKTSLQIYSIEDDSQVYHYPLNKKIAKMEFYGDNLFIVSGNLYVFTYNNGNWHYMGEIGESNGSITQKLKKIILVDHILYLYYRNRLVTYSLHDCRKIDIIDGKLWDKPIEGLDLTSLKNSISWVGNQSLQQTDIISEVGDDSLKAKSYGDGRLVVESGDEIFSVLSEGRTLLMSASISGDGKRAATLGFHIFDGKRKIQLWDLDQEQRIDNLNCPPEVKKIHLSDTGKWIMGETKEGTWVFDSDSFQERWYNEHFISNHAGRLVTYNNKVIREKDGTLFLYDLQNGVENQLESPVHNPKLVCFLPNEKLAAVDKFGRKLYMRSTRDDKMLSINMDGQDILSIQAVNGKPFIAVFTSDKFIRIYHTGNGQCLIKQAGSSTASQLVAHQKYPLLADTDGRRYLETRYFEEQIKWGKEIGHWEFYPYRHEDPIIDSDILDVAFNVQNQQLVAILANGKIMFCNDRDCKFRDSFKIVTAFNVSAYDFSNCLCQAELKQQLMKNGANIAIS